jgi:multisubunit Na+/H+ antiporter MnhF subunit
MTSEELAGILRAVLAALGGVLVTKGYLDNATMLAIVGAIVTIAVAAWSVWQKKSAAAAAAATKPAA